MKKIILTLIILFYSNISSAQLISYQLVQSFSINDLNQIIANFGASNLITAQYPVDFYRIYYTTEYNDSTVVVTGALAVPQGHPCKMPLVSYQHGTTSRKLKVPSYLNNEGNLSAIFASEGKIVCAPDHIGLGGSTINIHPYIHAYSQAHSTINLLRCSRILADSLNYTLSNQLFLFGYSQGGYSTAATAKYIEDYYSNEFKITAALPMSGPYNLAGAQTDFVDNGQPYATPGYMPYIVLGYQSVYHDLYTNLSDIFISPYDSTMPNYFYGHQYGMGTINNNCDSYPINMFTQSARDDFYNDPNFPFRVHLNENDLLSWTPQCKMRMYYCTGDEQVYYRNAEIADSVWNYNGAPDVEAVYLTNEDHGGCFDNALIAGKLTLEQLNNNGIEIILEFDQSTQTMSVNVLDDDINDYSIEWNDQTTGDTLSTENSLSNVQYGTSYSITLTHNTTACSNSKSFTTESVIGINETIQKPKIIVYPNPATQYIHVKTHIKNSYSYNIINALGKIVSKNKIPFGKEFIIPVNNLTNGIYTISVTNERQNYYTSFIKK